jgi:hypothetical protein
VEVLVKKRISVYYTEEELIAVNTDWEPST